MTQITPEEPLYPYLQEIETAKNAIEDYLKFLRDELKPNSVELKKLLQQDQTIGNLKVKFYDDDGIVPWCPNQANTPAKSRCVARIFLDHNKFVHFIGLDEYGWKYDVHWLNFNPSPF